jgi:arsenate reductase
MREITLYHNAKCNKSKEGLAILEKEKVQFKVVEYLKKPLTVDELDELLQVLDIEPDQIIRKNEDLYQELRLEKSPPSSRESWLKLITENPILIERPIVSDGNTGVIGRPADKISKWLYTIRN